MLHPEKFVKLGIDPPKGVLCYGPPGTGKTLLARAVANRTDACFIRVIGSELVQKYVGEGARMVRELFQVISMPIFLRLSSSALVGLEGFFLPFTCNDYICIVDPQTCSLIDVWCVLESHLCIRVLQNVLF